MSTLVNFTLVCVEFVGLVCIVLAPKQTARAVSKIALMPVAVPVILVALALRAFGLTRAVYAPARKLWALVCAGWRELHAVALYAARTYARFVVEVSRAFGQRTHALAARRGGDAE